MKKFFKISGIVLAVIILTVFLFMLWTYIRIQRGDLVKWDNEWYTKEELKEKFPPQYIDVPAKNTPEQAYEKFRQALLDDDIEGALEQIREESREEYREIFKDIDQLNEYQTIPETNKIKKSEYDSYENFSSYYYKEKEKVYSIEFEKDENGYWKIDFI